MAQYIFQTVSDGYIVTPQNITQHRMFIIKIKYSFMNLKYLIEDTATIKKLETPG